MRNCVDIVRPFSEALGERQNVHVIGGIGSAALAHAETVIVEDEKRVIAPADLFVPQYRPNGSLRDLDGLVLTTDHQVLAEVEALAEELIGDQLELEFFDLKPLARLESMVAQPLKSIGQKVSDRYVLEAEEEGIIVARKALYPFSVDMPREVFDTWQLFIGEKDPFPTPIPDPRSIIPNYLTRSVSGLRPRDKDKVGAAVDNVCAKMPGADEWLIDGPGHDQIELARILQTISRPGSLAVGQSLVIQPVSGSLREHPAFMIPEASEATQLAVLAATKLMSRAIHVGESQKWIASLYEKHFQKHFAKSIHNE